MIKLNYSKLCLKVSVFIFQDIFSYVLVGLCTYTFIGVERRLGRFRSVKKILQMLFINLNFLNRLDVAFLSSNLRKIIV